MRKLLFFVFLMIAGLSFGFAQDFCSNFKIVSIHDFPPSPTTPGGNFFLLLLTVEVDNPVNSTIYTDLFFVDELGDTISIPTGPSSHLPVYSTDTIPYVLKLSTTLPNQDFPIEFNGKLVIIHPTQPYCEVPYSTETSSSNDLENMNSLIIYPNPFVNEMKVQSETPIEQVTIFNSIGEVIKDYQPQATSFDISLSQEKKGEYFVAIQMSDGKTTVRKVSNL